MWFDKIKSYFDTGLWSVEMVSKAVAKGKISEDEYQQIVGIPYQEGSTGEDIDSRVSELEHENFMLKAQIKAMSGRNDFIEDCIAEMAMAVYA